MADIDLTGPWQAVLSCQGEPVADIDDLIGTEDVDISICRRTAIPVEVDGILDWPRGYSGDDVIELWDDVEPDEAELRWAQARAMCAGLNAAGGAA